MSNIQGTTTLTCANIDKHVRLSQGIYYQAEIQGELVTWLVPHSFPHVRTHEFYCAFPIYFDSVFSIRLIASNRALPSLVIFGFIPNKDVGLTHPPRMDTGPSHQRGLPSDAHLPGIPCGAAQVCVL